MRILVDTNVPICLFQSSNPSSPIAASAVHELKKFNFEVVMVPQNLYELWVVATRPVTLNGFGMSVSDASLLQEKCIQQLRLLRDERGIFDHWSQIVSSTPVIGKSVHDARLVAAMIADLDAITLIEGRKCKSKSTNGLARFRALPTELQPSSRDNGGQDSNPRQRCNPDRQSIRVSSATK